MLKWIKSALTQYYHHISATHLSTATEPDVTKPLQTSKEPDKNENTYLYIWNMTTDSPGHAAMQIGGNHPKMNENDSGEYVSIHPRYLPSMGPMTMIPLQAFLASTLQEDMESEAASQVKDTTNDLETPPHYSLLNPEPLPPDQIIKLSNLDTTAMRAYITEVRESVTAGKIGYQLLPQINLLSFFKDSASFVNHDPIDVEMNRRMTEEHQQQLIKAKNCSTLVREILNAGGMQIKDSRMPWGITPNGLAEAVKSRSMGR